MDRRPSRTTALVGLVAAVAFLLIGLLIPIGVASAGGADLPAPVSGPSLDAEVASLLARGSSISGRSSGPASHVYDLDVARTPDDAGALLGRIRDAYATSGAGPRWGGRVQGEAGFVQLLGGRSTSGNPLTSIPDDARVRVLRPDPDGGAQYAVEYSWRSDGGQTVRFRAHGPDGAAPAGSNAAMGDTYRVQIGGRYLDDAGNLQPRGVHNPRSPNYDHGAADATHMPFGMGIPNPFTGGCS